MRSRSSDSFALPVTDTHEVEDGLHGHCSREDVHALVERQVGRAVVLNVRRLTRLAEQVSTTDVKRTDLLAMKEKLRSSKSAGAMARECSVPSLEASVSMPVLTVLMMLFTSDTFVSSEASSEA